jgi:energy-coupling factor transporter transmembrane protein EcfT
VIKNLIPYDSLDFDIDIVRADTYLSGRFKIRKCADLEPYSARVMQTVLRKHHRNAITATIFALLVLWVSGIFIDEPRMRIPAGAGFLLLFAVVMGVVGAMKYFLRSWEVLGWIVIVTLLSVFVQYHVFDVRSIAYGIDYRNKKPVYSPANLDTIFTQQVYERDKKTEEQRLHVWNHNHKSAPLVIIAVSGGGTRAAYWTFRTLQYIDSLTKGELFKNTVLITGASGGMIGAAYWREVHGAFTQGKIESPYQEIYQENVGKDLLNAIIFSLVSVDLISPFNKISVAGYSYKKDRGYAMEQEMIRNSVGLLDKKLDDYRQSEMSAEIPAMIINATIITTGRG